MNDPKALGYLSHIFFSPLPVVRADIFNEMSLCFTSSSFRGEKKMVKKKKKNPIRSERGETTGVGYRALPVKGRMNALRRRR